jgi:hypothetical protein
VTRVLVLVVALHAPPARPAPLPVYHAAPTVYHAAPTAFHLAPPVFHVAPPVYHVAPPVYHPAPPITRRTVPVDLPIEHAEGRSAQTNSVALPDQYARPRWAWPGLWNPVVFWHLNPYCFGSAGSYWGEWGMLATPNDANTAYQFGPWAGNASLLDSGLQTFCGTPAFIGL